MSKKIFYLLLFTVCLFYFHAQEQFDLNREYSKDEFQNGIRSFHATEYELAILHFLKSLQYKEDNHLSRLFLGEAYRKAGYEKSAIYTWNTLLRMGYDNRQVKNKLSYLYNKRGMLTDILIDKDYILREDILGYHDGNKTALFLKPSQITVGRNNHYFIASFLSGFVAEFNSNFQLVKNYMPKLPELKKPFGIAVDRAGFIYVSDFENDVVLKVNPYNVVVKKIGYKGIGEGGLLGPKYLLLDDQENLYVVDSGNKRINKYNKEGNILFSFGNNAAASMESPAGLYYKEQKIYVCDSALNTIYIYDKSGNFLGTMGDEKLYKPYDITQDKFGRFLILCEDKLWAYEPDNGLWYIIEAPGKRLSKGISVVTDQEDNILISDFNSSRLLVLSLERHRFTNLALNIERVYTQKYPTVHLSVHIEKDNFKVPIGLNSSNISVYENGKYISNVGLKYTDLLNDKSDIIFILDNNDKISPYKEDIKTLVNSWLKKTASNTQYCLFSFNNLIPVLNNDFSTNRLGILDSIQMAKNNKKTDLGNAIKFAINHSLKRFSKKAIVILTNSHETGSDFEKFKIEDCINFAHNNDIPIYIVAFNRGNLSAIFNTMGEKTYGQYHQLYQSKDLHKLIQTIERSKSRQFIISYQSKAVSRFQEEPINISLEVNYSGMKGVAQTIYYPPKN